MVESSSTAIEHKVSLTNGLSFWESKAPHGHEAVTFSDGPHGVRRQEEATDHLGIARSAPATCFPPAAALGQTWDPSLIRRVGAALGAEAKTLGVSVLLGPGVNIKRDPRGGRNFEYYSEDPHLTGILGASWVRGLQSEGVGAALKHFAANNSETDRMRASSDVDERTLREIYLRAFEHIVKTAAPWTVMTSYNRLNGVYTSENRWLLTDVLRTEWGFDGVVISDWGGVQDRVAALEAGLDLEMPGNGGVSDAIVLKAVQNGDLDEAIVEAAARRVSELSEKAEAGAVHPTAYDPDRHHALAQEVAGRSVVLLQNDGVLPLSSARDLVVIGEFAVEPRIQGGGSSKVVPTMVDSPLDEIRLRTTSGVVRFARGFSTVDGANQEALLEEAVALAGTAGTVVLFLGVGANQESEGFDRESIDLPADQVRLLAALTAVHDDVVVVLSHGGVLQLGAVRGAAAILDGSLLGQGGGAGIADVLFGLVNPAGRVAETIPNRLQDVPAYLTAFPENQHTVYGERHFVGYRWYDAKALDVAFPFGHGLSYTSFDYSGLGAEVVDDKVMLSFTVTNTGDVTGREVPQIYVGKGRSEVSRAPRSLAGFANVEIEPGQSERIVISVPMKDLAYWNTRLSRWTIEGGDYVFWAGASSRDLRLSTVATVTGDEVSAPLSLNSTLGEVLAHPEGRPLVRTLFGDDVGEGAGGEELGIDMARMMASIPIVRWVSLSGGTVSRDALKEALESVTAGTAHIR